MPLSVWTNSFQSEDADAFEKRGGRQCIRGKTNAVNGNIFHSMYQDGGAWKHFQSQFPFAAAFPDVIITSTHLDGGSISLDFNDNPIVSVGDNALSTLVLHRYDSLVNNWNQMINFGFGSTNVESHQILGDPIRDGVQYLVFVTNQTGDYLIRMNRTSSDWDPGGTTNFIIQGNDNGVDTLGPENQRGLCAAIDNEGNVNIAWSTRDPVDDRYKIYYVLFDAITLTFGPIELVEDTGPFSDSRYFTKEMQMILTPQDNTGGNKGVHLIGLNESQTTTTDVRYWRKLEVNWSIGESVLPIVGDSVADVSIGLSFDAGQELFPFVLYSRPDGTGAIDLLYAERSFAGVWSGTTLVDATTPDSIRNPQIPSNSRHLSGFIDIGGISLYHTDAGVDRHRFIYTTTPVLSFADDQAVTQTVEFIQVSSDTPIFVLEIFQTVDFTETLAKGLTFSAAVELQTVNFTETVIKEGNLFNLIVAHTVDFSDGANDIIVGPNPYQTGAPGYAPDPPILACGLEDSVLFVYFVGPLPGLETQIQLKRPDFSRDMVAQLRINTKRSRGGNLRQHIRGDTTERIRLPFSQLHRIKMEELRDFLEAIKGKEFYYLDEEDRTMRVALISSQVSFRNEGREPAGRALLEIEGVFI